MRNQYIQISLVALSAALISTTLLSFIQQQDPWRIDQLLNPADLAATISNSAAEQPVIISIGPGGVIPKSIEIGPAGDAANLEKLETHLSTLSKDSHIVIYCGCCPFNRCPNVRPAFRLLNSQGFTNHKLLNLAQNVKTDWIDRGYPTQ